VTVERLTAAGYVYIGMDHFALPGDELVRAKAQRTLHRNFQGYSTRAHCDLVGLGVSAISKVGDAYAQNCKLLPDYYAAIDAGHLAVQRGVRLNEDDRVRAAVIQELMCHESVDAAAIEHEFGIDFQRYFARELDELRKLEADDLTWSCGTRLGITDRGRLLMRNVAMTFDAYAAQQPAVTGFSRDI
jgi:oxygen-independent coproporphyrinogen-3 oxidase